MILVSEKRYRMSCNWPHIVWQMRLRLTSGRTVSIGRVLRVYGTELKWKSENFIFVIFYCFCSGKAKKAADAKREICAVYGASALSAERWFAFVPKNLTTKMLPVLDSQLLLTTTNFWLQRGVIDTWLQSLRSASAFIIWPLRTVWKSLRKTDGTAQTNRKEHHGPDFGVWVSSEMEFPGPISEADHHWKLEMSCLDNNIKRQKSWCGSDESSQTVKPDLQKVMLSVWWDYKGVLVFKLLPQTIDSKKSSSTKVVWEKWSELSNRKGIFHYDNIRPHTPYEEKNCKVLDGKWCSIHHTRRLLRRPTITCFARCKTILMVNGLIQWRLSAITWRLFRLQVPGILRSGIMAHGPERWKKSRSRRSIHCWLNKLF